MRKKPNRRRSLSLESLEARRLLAVLVTPAQASQTVEVNQEFTIATNYTTNPPEQTTGVGIRLHFDPSKVDFDLSDATLSAESVPFKVVDPRLFDETTSTDDGDPLTSKYIQVQFADFVPPPDFPASLVPLFQAKFTAKATGTATFNYTFPFDNTIPASSATVTITEALPTVGVAVSPGSVVEDGSPNLIYTFTRSGGDTSQELTVNYVPSGSATAGTDYSGTSTSVTIPVDMTEATVTVDPTVDADVETDETVILTISPRSGVYNVGAANVATGTVTNDDMLPTVGVAVSPSSVLEDGSPNLIYTFTRTGGDTSQALTVNYVPSGSATAGTDYTGSGTNVVIPGGATTATVTVDPTVDADVETDETVILTISPSSGVYNVGAANVATGTITNDDALTPPSVNVTASQSGAESVGTMTVTATLSAPTASDVTVPFTVTGTATGADYTITSSPITIAAGSTSADITITVTDDAIDESNETVIVTLETPTGATPGATTVHTATINDNDEPVVTVPTVRLTSASQSGAESVGTMIVTATLSAPSTSNVTVPFSVTGTATGTDYTITSSPIMIAAGSTSADITINVIDDNVDEGNETVIVTLGSPTNANLGTTRVHTATISDNDGVSTGGNRIMIPRTVVRPHVIPGDGRPTAILFRAVTDTTLKLGAIGVVSMMPEVSMLDENLAPIGGRNSNGLFTADLLAGGMYAMIFTPFSTERLFFLRSSAGADALVGSVPTNLLSPTDVNADGESTAQDALLVINEMNRQSVAEGEHVRKAAPAGRHYDVNQDGELTAADALRVINELHRIQARGEGEFAGVPSAILPDSSNTTDDERLADTSIVSTQQRPEIQTDRPLESVWLDPSSANVDFAEAVAAPTDQVDDLFSDEAFMASFSPATDSALTTVAVSRVR